MAITVAVRFRPGSEALVAQLDSIRQTAEADGDVETARLARMALNGHDGKGFVSGAGIDAALAALTARKLI